MDKITRVTTVKEMLQEEFGNTIGFHERIHKNKSIIVYNKADCGTFIDAALHSFGISGQQLICNVAKHLHEKYRYSNNMEWPPYVSQLKDEGNLESVNLLVKLISWMKDPSRKTFENDPNVSALCDLLLSLINGKRTLFKTQLAITIHGLTRNKEVVQLLHKFGLAISYNDTIDLESTWAYHENQVSQVSPKELAYGNPGFAVIDDDEFREDTLAGGRTSHRTNMMFVQPVKLVMSVESQEALIIPTKKQKTEMAASQTSVEAYHTQERKSIATFRI